MGKEKGLELTRVGLVAHMPSSTDDSRGHELRLHPGVDGGEKRPHPSHVFD